MFKRFKISTRLVVGFLLVALLVGFVGIFAIRSNSTIQKNNEIEIEIRELMESLDDLLRGSLQLIGTQTLDDYREIKSGIEGARKNFDILHKRNDEIRHTLGSKDFDKDIADFTKISNGIIAIHKEKLVRKREFDEKAVLERDLRRKIRSPLFALKDTALTEDIGSMQYKSKEALYQYMDQKHVDEWLEAILTIKNKVGDPLLIQDIVSYNLLAQSLGGIVIEQQEAETDERIRVEQLRDLITKLEENEETIVAAIRSENELLVKNTRLTLLAVVMVAFSVSIALGLYISRSISGPVGDLSQTAQAIAAGDLARRAAVTSRDEVGQLAGAFNEMADKLEESYRGLEEKVATRTEELTASNMRLQKIAQKLTIARTELERAIVEKGEFMNVAAHELRTPLQPIIGYANRILMKSKLSSWQRDRLNIVLESADRLLRLVQDILDINKMETGVMKFSMKETDLLRSIKDVYESLKPSAEAKKLGFVFKAPETLSKVRGDSQRLMQVFSNLIDNAVRFTERGSITIAVQEDKNTVKISVADTGIGISEKDIGKLFTKFFQAASYLVRGHEGTGLGLAISKEILKAHKGDITVKSEPGKGSTFTVVLPKLDAGKKPT